MKVGPTKEQCIHDICRFPLLCKEPGVTPLEVVRKTGYSVFCEDIKIKDIIDELKKDKNSITTWLNFTADKRWTPAWGVVQKNSGYELFYMSTACEIELKVNFKDPFEACAFMIRMEMEEKIE